MTGETIVQVINDLAALVEENQRLREENAQLKARRLDNRPKLGTKEVENIKDLRRAGYKVAEIAEIYDVNKSTISRTLRGIYH